MDRPIIFSAPMVRALIDGRKTMTRRLAWRYKVDVEEGDLRWPSPWQRVKPGDLLWVRESFGSVEVEGGGLGYFYIVYDADEWSHYDAKGRRYGSPRPKELRPSGLPCKLYPSIHMPRWASRLTLEVTATKIERLQEIGTDDARKEGVSESGAYYIADPTDVQFTWSRSPREAFKQLWESLNGADAWAANPEVVALTFKIHHANIDAIERKVA